MITEAYIENNQMRVINFPKEFLKSKHWKINIEPIEEIKDDFKNLSNKTSGILIGKNIDPIKWQEEIRNEWER